MRAADDDPRLDQLVDLVVKLAAGELSARLEPTPARDAVNAVIHGVNLLAEELQEVYRGLEERVAERTAALHQAHADLQRLALTDALTGLANRTRFGERVSSAIAESAKGARPPAVLLLDLDEFKAVNDTLGHSAGDAVLVEVARRLGSVVRDVDTVARLGGDEFAILLPAASSEQAHLVAERCLEALRRPVAVGQGAVWAKSSIGVRFGTQGCSADVLLRDADTAMYAAKARGRGTVAVFDPRMHAVASARLQVAGELGMAIAQGRLTLLYQPVVDLASGAIIGAEALVRWMHPDRGMIPPEDFIRIAAESQLITELGSWVVRAAITQLGRWHRLLPASSAFQLHVNLSAADVRRRRLAPEIRRALQRAGVPANRLTVELTETGLMTGEVEGLRTLERLRALGVGIQIDDFGTGYSSISYLRRLPADTVKVDRSLIADIASDRQQYAFVGAILHLIDSVGLRAVVEGIETAEQRRELLRLGCRYGQGYLFSRPVPAQELTPLLSERALLGLPGGRASGYPALSPADRQPDGAADGHAAPPTRPHGHDRLAREAARPGLSEQ